MILVDTSVWIDHLRRGNPRLQGLLLDGQVLAHAFVAGELACLALVNRAEILGLLADLPQAPAAAHEEVLHLVEQRRLGGRGLGWIDAHLLASALLAPCALWTLDACLARAATSLGLARAALEGKSLSEYLLQQVRAAADRPTIDEMRQRLAERSRPKLSMPPTEALREERDSR